MFIIIRIHLQRYKGEGDKIFSLIFNRLCIFPYQFLNFRSYIQYTTVFIAKIAIKFTKP